MQISDLFRGLGEETFGKIVRGISIGKLKTYQIYEGFKIASMADVGRPLHRLAACGSDLLDDGDQRLLTAGAQHHEGTAFGE